MTSHKLLDEHISISDFSLISESSLSDLNFEEKGSLKYTVNKQVRFQSEVNINPFLNSSIISDASLLDSESKFNGICDKEMPFSKIICKNNFNTLSKYNPNASESYQKQSNSNGIINYKTKNIIENTINVKSKDISKEEDINDNTSVWSSETELSEGSIVNNLSSLKVKDNFFKTIDGLSSGFSNDSSSAVETIISDEITDNGNANYGTSGLSKPSENSTRCLKGKIAYLEKELEFCQVNLSETAQELAAKQLAEQLNLNERLSCNNPLVLRSQVTAELTQPLNVRPSVEMFPDLTRLSVHDDSIVESQQRKVAAIRKKVGADKLIRNIEGGLPVPDVMEFFDPAKHLFQSVNMSMEFNVINLKPMLSLTSTRLYSVFRERDILSQFD